MSSAARFALHISGASVTGPAHRDTASPNEDAWRKEVGAFGAIMVVSDGVGSCQHARYGSRMVCRAVCETVREYQGANIAPSRLFAQIESAWRRLVAPRDPRDSAATCLFAWMRPHGRLLVAGIGDGLAVVIRTMRKAQWVVGPRLHGFSNETAALGMAVACDQWQFWSCHCASDVAVVLASDGVSDDIHPARADDFVEWLVAQTALRSPRTRSQALRRHLHKWPTPNHLDDKTLAVMLARRDGMR